MVCKAGVDEAGLGPILGPLTVCGTNLVLPSADADPYHLLADVVTRKKRTRKDERLLVDDSKRVCTGRLGAEKLERTALAFMTLAWGETPGDLDDLSQRLLAGGTTADRAGCQWLEKLDLKLPIFTSPGQIELDCWRLSRAAEATGFGLKGLYLTALHPAGFNRSIADTGNKSRTHFGEITQVLGELLDLSPDEVVLDRTGGLIHHSIPLARAFPGTGVTRLGETKEAQGYLLKMSSHDQIEIWFREKAEDHSFAVALASCMAKYLRESFMECLNRWFCARLPGLKPTKGYYVDGLRFLEDVKEVAQKEMVNPDFFIRTR